MLVTSATRAAVSFKAIAGIGYAMRNGLMLLACLALAGCTEGSSDGLSDEAPLLGPAAWSETFSSPLVASEALPGQDNAVSFDVPEGATHLVAEPRWSCVSLCRMHVWLEDPEGAVAAETTRGGGGDALEVEMPASGTWQFRWLAAEGASVGIEGSIDFTVHFQ